MLLSQISSTAKGYYMDCSKKLHRVNLLAIINIYRTVFIHRCPKITKKLFISNEYEFISCAN